MFRARHSARWKLSDLPTQKFWNSFLLSFHRDFTAYTCLIKSLTIGRFHLQPVTRPGNHGVGLKVLTRISSVGYPGNLCPPPTPAWGISKTPFNNINSVLQVLVERNFLGITNTYFTFRLWGHLISGNGNKRPQVLTKRCSHCIYHLRNSKEFRSCKPETTDGRPKYIFIYKPQYHIWK